MSRVTDLVADHPVVIFTKSNCCMSHSITSLITGYAANPTVYKLDMMHNGREIERELVELGCNPSVPAVFIGQEFTGGASQIISLQVKNQLASALRGAGAIWM